MHIVYALESGSKFVHIVFAINTTSKTVTLNFKENILSALNLFIKQIVIVLIFHFVSKVTEPKVE